VQLALAVDDFGWCVNSLNVPMHFLAIHPAVDRDSIRATDLLHLVTIAVRGQGDRHGGSRSRTHAVTSACKLSCSP